mmetsp:Transcript_22201/g.36299  ORF Transcript_22201/g.36299 Transcript_22201/m.36299 type:complete len:1318 (-) Transcript_22201:84-4037(-)
MASTQRPNPVDPAWSPHVLVSRRLRDACVTNASRLSERSTIEASSSHIDPDPVPNVVHPLAQIALARSSCSQPPLDDGITGGGSSVSCDVHYSGMDLRLDPLERAAPHKIVVPFEENDYTNGLGHTTSLRGELDGRADANLAEVRSSTWNAINALASLCDEVQEINNTFHSQILPSIVLFSADDSLTPKQSKQTISKTDVFDDDAQKGRESQLLSRIGKFMPALQLASNGTARLRRLVKNMVCQLGGCATPAAVPFYFDGQQSQELTPNDSEGAASDAKKAKQGQTTQSPVFGEGVPMFRLGKAIGIALRLLITVDSAVASNEDLQHAWAMYKDVVMEWSEQKRSDDELDEEFESFERMMVQLDFSLMSSRSFIAAIEQNFDPRGRFQEAKYDVHEEIRHILTTLYAQNCERINTEDETTERLDCVGVYAMYVLYRHLLPPNVVPDAKLHKSLWSVFPVMCPIMNLFGPLHFLPREFMMLHAPYEAVRGCSADSSEIREAAASLVLKWDGSFKARVEKLRLSALGWLAMADSELSPTIVEGYPRFDDNDDIVDGGNFTLASSLTDIETASSYILHGVKIAHSASILLRGQLLTHKALGLELDSSHIPSMLSLIEVLKAIEKMLRVRRRSAVLSLQRSTLTMIASNILKIFEKVRSFVDQRSASTAQSARSIARVSACLSTMEGILKGSSSFSPFRRHAVAFSIAASLDPMILENVISTDDLLDVESYLKDLSHFAAIEETLYNECDCSFLYFYRDLFPAFVQNLYKSSQGSALTHTQSVFSALSDPERILVRVRHLDRNESSGLTPSAFEYHKFVSKLVNEEYIEPLCEFIETDLRFAVYSKNSDSSKRYDNGRFAAGVRKLITAPPLYICRQKIDVKSEIESYLEKTFYNLSTVSLNDCNNYTEMRSIANERYSLNLVDPSLPDGSLDQRLDFIDVLRNLESFVSSYNYNMIEQNFVQRKAERGVKSLRTLGVKSVASSLKQHGLGVVSLTIDVCSVLLSQKIELLLDFLSDDSIKSLLSKELRWIGNQRKEGNNVYPFIRALEFTQEMKRLIEQSQSKQNGLEWCRSVITEMGNTLAMARMVRTARRKVLSDEMSFLSPIDVSIVKGKNESTGKVETGKNIFSNTTGEVEDNISAVLIKPDPDIVQGFTAIFQESLLDHEDSFMSGFHCMLPALCLCWMDASLQGKEMMHKKNIARGGYYTDDGFAVGLAFILSAADQRKMYDRLNWFKSIQSKYASDEEDMMERMTAEEIKKDAKIAAAKQSSWFSSSGVDTAQEDSEELKNLKLMEKRIEGHRRELAMLFFSMNEATAFLRSF